MDDWATIHADKLSVIQPIQYPGFRSDFHSLIFVTKFGLFFIFGFSPISSSRGNVSLNTPVAPSPPTGSILAPVAVYFPPPLAIYLSPPPPTSGSFPIFLSLKVLALVLGLLAHFW